MRQPWEKDLDDIRIRQLDDLRAWRSLLLPLSAFATVLFFVSLERTGSASMETAFSFIASSSLTLWLVAIEGRIDGILPPGL